MATIAGVLHISPDDTLYERRFAGVSERFYPLPAAGGQWDEVVQRASSTAESYHERDHGYELRVLEQGTAEVTICGKRCCLQAGDSVVIPPFVPYGFDYPEGEARWTRLLTGMDYAARCADIDRLRTNFLDQLQDPTFAAAIAKQWGDTCLAEPEPESMQPEEIPFVCRRGTCAKQYRFAGITANLLFGRWDFAGEREIWELVLQEGLQLCWEAPIHTANLFVVRAGRVWVEASSEKGFAASPGDLLYIPPFTPHTITALEDGSTLRDYGCRAKMMRFVEDMEILQARRPQALLDPQAVEAVRRRHACPLSAVRRGRRPVAAKR